MLSCKNTQLSHKLGGHKRDGEGEFLFSRSLLCLSVQSETEEREGASKRGEGGRGRGCVSESRGRKRMGELNGKGGGIVTLAGSPAVCWSEASADV